MVVVNRFVNPMVRWILRSPIHGILSSRLALITVTGRRSGHVYTMPVGYRQGRETVTINVGAPDRKQWWRNLRDGGPVRLRLQGEDRDGWATVTGDQDSGVVVAVDLGAA
jgi:hypothetical protein